jgi:hypothetical protein
MPFVPGSYLPPRRYRSVRFTAEVLSPYFAAQDYAAVKTSADAIRHVFGPDNGWPAATMSFAENLADLERHAREFEERTRFAYALLSPDGDRYLGCFYLRPTRNAPHQAAYDAEAFFWLSALANRGDLAERVLEDLQIWLKAAWPFRAVAFPGRTIGWTEW